LKMVENLEKENEKLREEKKRLETKVRDLELLNKEYKKALGKEGK